MNVEASLKQGTRAGRKGGEDVDHRSATPCFPHAVPSSVRRILTSHPQSRLSGLCRTAAGHRRRVRQHTPALTRQPGQRPPSLPRFCLPAPSSDATWRTSPRIRTPFGAAIEGVRGESFPPMGHGATPHIPSLPSLPSLSSCRASGGCRRRGGRSGGRAGGRCRGRYGRRSPDARLRPHRRGLRVRAG